MSVTLPSARRVSLAPRVNSLYSGRCDVAASVTRSREIASTVARGPSARRSLHRRLATTSTPATRPDGNFIIYNRSPANTSSLGIDPNSGTSAIPDAQMWFVSSSGGTPVSMDTAHGLSDAWPRFNPTTFTDHGHPLFGLVWASRRQYGLRLDEGTRSQLWMCTFDPTRAAAGQDPTSVPFWVPRQDVSVANHLAQWTLGVARNTCTNDGDCGGEFCYQGRCYQQMPVP